MDVVNKIGLEKVVAVTAALITGVAVYMMPQAVLQEAVVASGLASVLSPLQPPLGERARIGLALFASGVAFALILTVLGLLNRSQAKPAKRAAPEPKPADEVPAPPRLRRRDRHPDAPPRAPLSVEREVGAPAPAAAPTMSKAAVDAPQASEASHAPMEPHRRIRAALLDTMKTPQPETEEEAPAEPEAEELLLSSEPDPEPVAVAGPEPSRAGPPARPSEPRPERRGQQPAWLDTSPRMEPAGQPPLVELVERLERALEARTASRAAPPASASRQAEAEPEMDGTDARLRSALESLKRFAPQRG